MPNSQTSFTNGRKVYETQPLYTRRRWCTRRCWGRALAAFVLSVVTKLSIAISKARTPKASKQCGQHGKNWQVLWPSQYSYMFYVIAQSTLTPDYDTCGSVNLRTIQCCEVSHFIRYRSISANFVLWKFSVRYARNFSALKWCGAVSMRVCRAGPAVPAHCVCLSACACAHTCTCVCTRAPVHTCARVCACLCTCVHVCVRAARRGLIPPSLQALLVG